MRMPVLFVGHGSPMNAIEENAFTRSLGEVRKKLSQPKSICVISAHWVTRGCSVLGMDWPRTIHDFYGFPKPLYEVQYPAPGAPEEAKRLALEHHLAVDHEWGLDHARTFKEHVALGAEMKKLRERRVLILASGNLVHNLRRINWDLPMEGYAWAEEFDRKVKKAIEERDAESLAAPNRWGRSC
jgi:4,5-DOPA dioxygenase extradiol